MKFEGRTRKAQSMLLDFLGQFSAPRGLSDDAMKKTIESIAQAFARKLPVTEMAKFEENVETTFTGVRDSHKGYAWPTQSEFVDAMPKSSATGPKVEAFKVDGLERAARQINSGAAVPDNWIWGAMSWTLVSGGHVSSSQMDTYRVGHVKQFKDVYGADAYGMAQNKYGDVVAKYFQGVEGAA